MQDCIAKPVRPSSLRTADKCQQNLVIQEIYGDTSGSANIAGSIVYSGCTDFSTLPKVFPPNWLPKNGGLGPANTE